MLTVTSGSDAVLPSFQCASNLPILSALLCVGLTSSRSTYRPARCGWLRPARHGGLRRRPGRKVRCQGRGRWLACVRSVAFTGSMLGCRSAGMLYFLVGRVLRIAGGCGLEP